MLTLYTFSDYVDDGFLGSESLNSFRQFLTIIFLYNTNKREITVNKIIKNSILYSFLNVLLRGQEEEPYEW